MFSGEYNGILAEVSFQYNDQYSETIISFVNNVRTKDGGTHEVGFKTGFTRVFNEYARKINELKDKDKNLEGNDIRDRKSTRLNSSHVAISYAVFCLKKKKNIKKQ